MQVLSFGFNKPETNDRGPVVFPALEDNWQQVNDHSHNGINSAKLSGASLEATNQAILAAGFTVVVGTPGHYEQTVTLPAGFSYDTTTISFQITATGTRIFPGIEKVSATQYKVLMSDNTTNITALLN